MSHDAITEWVSQLRRGDQQAAQRLFDAYYRRIVGLARKRLAGQGVLIADEEDIALSAFKSFCLGIGHGRFERVTGRDDLWKLLVGITVHKAMHLVRDERRIKRGGDRRRHSQLDAISDAELLAKFVESDPSPELAAVVTEEADRLLASLGDAELIELAVLKMEGYSNAEIAKRWNKAERTVERNLSLIRKIWLGAATGGVNST